MKSKITRSIRLSGTDHEHKKSNSKAVSKTFYIGLLLLLITYSASAQIVNIPDPNFKAALLAPGSWFSDGNSNGEVDQNEAVAVRMLNIENANISSLQGIEAFTNLSTLWAKNNQITSIDLTNLTHLAALDVSHNQLTTIDFSNQNSMSVLDISYNQINTVNLPIMIGSDMFGFDISGNNYTTINIPTGTELTSFICNDTHLTSLDLSGVRFVNYVSQEEQDFSIANNPQLEFVNLRNGIAQTCTPFTDEYGFTMYCGIFNMQNNPNLTGVCVDNSELNYYQSYFSNQPNVVVSSYCSLNPAGRFNTISGNITFDCGGSNILLNNQDVTISSATLLQGHTYSNANGQFAFYTGGGDRVVTLQLENPSFFTVTPANYTFNLSFNGGSVQTANFCITPNGTHPDLEISILPIDAARPGFDAHYKIVYKNKGNQIQSGTVAMNFEDTTLDYVSSSVSPSSQSTNSVAWNFTDLTPFESRSIVVTFNVNSPQEIPAVNNGDVLVYRAEITPSETDETPFDNHALLNQTVVGSQDPNDKIVLEGSQLDQLQGSNYLHYIVRFQNTGTYAAQNVVVKDILSNNLDWNTLKIVSSSHLFRSTLTSGNKLEVFYKDINLPPASMDEPGSHGYIAFKIKPISSFVLSGAIDNYASIYFDFNFPIITNTVTSSVVTLGNVSNASNLFTLSPNPTSGILNISTSHNQTITKATISTILGQTVMEFGNQNAIDVSSLNKGIYFVTLETDSGKATQRIIKQ